MKKMNDKTLIRAAALLLSITVAGASFSQDMAWVCAEETLADKKTAQETDSGFETETAAIEESEMKKVSIRTAEDLQAFAEGCISDAYSRNKRFVLEADIDLTGVTIAPAPIFCGIFDGGGHTISGYEMQETGSDLGFIRFLEKDGMVKNLTIEGTLQPGGSSTNIGGIVGTNRGSIENCRFSGDIIAREASGGIVGYNEETGIIKNCKNEGKLLCTKKTGGIAGVNEGLITNCMNQGGINATSETVSDAEGEGAAGMNLQISMSLSEMTADEERITSTGGIAGVSAGTVERCTNHGAVGYPHVGYRTGGIVGYQRGCIDNCQNDGTVQGRKDTGGIAGLFEPYVEIDYEEGTANQLRDEMDDLIDMFSDLSDITRDADKDTLDNMDAVDESIDVIRDSLDRYKEYYQRKNDEFIDDMEEALDIVESRIDMLDFNVDDETLADAIISIRRDVETARKILESMSSLSDTTEIMESLGITEDELLKALEQVGWDGSGAPSQDQIQAALQQAARNKVLELTQDMDSKSDALSKAARDIAGETSSLADNADKLGTEIKHVIHVAENHIKDIRDNLRKTEEDLSNQMDVLDARIDVLKNRLRDANNDVLDQLDRITGQIRRINNTASKGFDDLQERIDGIDSDKEFYDYYDDLSDTTDTEQGRGKIINCRNEGEIISDINGGGIAGFLSVEVFDSDSEFEITEKGSRSLTSNRSVTGLVYGCKNSSEVTVKNDYAGGIVGRADMGAVVACQNYGDVETTDGDHAGGIAGKSGYMIRGSYTLSNIIGNNYVGGIAGEGSDIHDNYAMTSVITDAGEKFGAIAGDADGSVSGNYFVDDGTAAVNGLTYERQAAPLRYEELIAMEGTPLDFRNFTIKFIADGEVLRTITCGYGDTLTESQIPLPPEKDGILGSWDKTDFADIQRNMVVRAVYGDWETALSSGGNLPELLVSGRFLPTAALICEWQEPESVPQLPGYDVLTVYRYQIQDSSLEGNTELGVHILADTEANPRMKDYRGKRLCAAILKDGKLELLDGKRDGRYYVFAMTGGAEGTVVLLGQESGSGIMLFIAAGVIVAAALLIILTRRKKKHSDIQAPESVQEGAALQKAKRRTGQEPATDEEEDSVPEAEETSEPEKIQ